MCVGYMLYMCVYMCMYICVYVLYIQITHTHTYFFFSFPFSDGATLVWSRGRQTFFCKELDVHTVGFAGPTVPVTPTSLLRQDNSPDDG